jgi:hypothetical protein
VSSIDVYRILEDKRQSATSADAEQAIGACIGALREAEKSGGYLGTLYRTDFEVEGTGAFPVDMLRYVCAWPKGESDAQAIEDSHDEMPRRRTVALSKYHRDPEPQLAGDRWEAKFRWRLMRVVETVAL